MTKIENRIIELLEQLLETNNRNLEIHKIDSEIHRAHVQLLMTERELYSKIELKNELAQKQKFEEAAEVRADEKSLRTQIMLLANMLKTMTDKEGR
jgi:hypothetical protein